MKLSSFSLAYAFVVASSGPLLPLAGVHGQSTAPALRRSAVGDEGGRSRRLYSSWYGGSGKGSSSSGKGKGHSGKGSSSSGKGHSGKGSGHSGKGKGDGGSSVPSGLTSSPTSGPTSSPTGSPTSAPTSSPTGSPTSAPTSLPTGSPTSAPTSLPTGSPTSEPTSSPTGSPTSTSSPTGVPTICGTELTGDNVLVDDIECDVANPGNSPFGCDTSSICLGVGSSLDCMGKTISKAVSASIADGVRMLSNSQLVNCTVTGFDRKGINVEQNAKDVLIKGVIVRDNVFSGIFTLSGSITTLTDIVANSNGQNGIYLQGSATLTHIVANNNELSNNVGTGVRLGLSSTATFVGIEACQNGQNDISLFASRTSLSGTNATYDTCIDNESGRCPTPKTNCTAP